MITDPFALDLSPPQIEVLGYEYEGAAKEDGRGPGIWDTLQFLREDVQIMKDMNLDAFRFSISWSRLLPRNFIIIQVN
ncbi:hypothetical protein Q3G72_013465 [Acer saccharum]|nr:hypothetical protein Q3G72_013465 [Acer saccharum]